MKFPSKRFVISVKRHQKRERWTDEHVAIAAIDIIVNMDRPRRSTPEGWAIVTVTPDYEEELTALVEKYNFTAQLIQTW